MLALAVTVITLPAAAASSSLSYVRVNGIRVRIAEQGKGPLVLMIHGFPESWYSWRHQLRALAAAGYRAVAPDMRGYGGTDAPAEVEAYDILDLCGDVTGLLDALGEEKAVLVGHDWGAVVAWYCALLEPARFTALVAMSVPWGPRADGPPLPRLRRLYGENFFYMLYFQEPGVAEAELDADPRGLLSRFFTAPDTPREPPRITDPRANAGGLIGRLGAPRELPPWLSQEDLDYYVAEFTRSGFRGGLNYYRNLDRNWELTPQLEGARITVPTLFIAGERDPVIGGRDKAGLERPMRLVAPDLRGVKLIAGAGHWIQQERADEINGLLIQFLQSGEEGR
ncbi:MAG: alpha/beta hydrolase [Gemmatimonadota bacterium]